MIKDKAICNEIIMISVSFLSKGYNSTLNSYKRSTTTHACYYTDNLYIIYNISFYAKQLELLNG